MINVITTWLRPFAPTGIRKECIETLYKYYPQLQILDRPYCEKITTEFFAEYETKYPEKLFENDVILSDYARAILLVNREKTLYIDTDIALHANLVFDENHPAIGFENGNLCNCILYNAGYSAFFRTTIEPWISRIEYLSPIFRFAFENVLMDEEYHVIKDGYHHFCLGSRNNWSNERNPL